VPTDVEARFPVVGIAASVSAFTLLRTLNTGVSGVSFPPAKRFTNLQ
jgi:hypothetical protein